jgi:putative acyl-CoA dehydrogenase
MDMRRSVGRDRSTLEAVMVELAAVQGADGRFDRFVAQVRRLVDAACSDEFLARPATEGLARAIQGAELIRHSTPEVADAFIVTRLGGTEAAPASMFGTLVPSITKATADRIVQRVQVTR